MAKAPVPKTKEGPFSKALRLMDDVPKTTPYEQFCSILKARWEAEAKKQDGSHPATP